MSVQKDDTLMNLVLIAVVEHGLDLNSAVQYIVRKLFDGIKTFEDAANTLRKTTERDFGQEAVAELDRLIEGYKTIATGVWGWTLQSRRYGISQFAKKNGQYAIPL